MLIVAWCLAILVDAWVGEPRRWHPLVGFGALAQGLEQRLNSGAHNVLHLCLGGFAVAVLVVPVVGLVYGLLGLNPWLDGLLQAAGLYFAIAYRSLMEHVRAVYSALRQGDLNLARERSGYIVSRNMTQADAPMVRRATIESCLENGCDGVFAPLFWFLLLGAPGAIGYRLVNTLDALWGYRKPRYLYFGRAAAKLDDLVNFFPARLVALSYGVLGHFRLAMVAWRRQAPLCQSPNAGPVMAAGAGALNVLLGGAATYEQKVQMKPLLGCGGAPGDQDLRKAMALVSRTYLVWILLGAGVLWLKL